MKGESIDLVASGKVVDGNFIIEALDGVPISPASEETSGESDETHNSESPSKPKPAKKKKPGFMESIEAQLGGSPS